VGGIESLEVRLSGRFQKPIQRVANADMGFIAFFLSIIPIYSRIISQFVEAQRAGIGNLLSYFRFL
jgi:hypothetical protein